MRWYGPKSWIEAHKNRPRTESNAPSAVDKMRILIKTAYRFMRREKKPIYGRGFFFFVFQQNAVKP